jgi:MoxR-like ATPase
MQLNICGQMQEVVKKKHHQIPAILKACIKLNQNAMFYGKSGIGKSQHIEQFAEENGYDLIKLNLALEVPETIGGIPTKKEDFEEYIEDMSDEQKDKTRRKRARRLIQYFTKLINEQLEPLFENPERFKILFLDEITQAMPEVFNCLYGVCDTKKRNWAGKPLNNVIVVAASNLNDGSDGTVYLNDLPTPLQNRFNTFELIADDKDTSDYLSAKYQHIPQVNRYIKLLLENHIPPREIENALMDIKYSLNEDEEGAIHLLESKLQSALTRKILEIKKDIASIDPMEMFKACRESYQMFKEYGKVSMGEKGDPDYVLITKEKDLIALFKDYGLSDEEIQSIKKGE